MWFTIFLIAIAFIVAIVYNSNKSSKSFQQSKQNLGPRRVTIDSIEKSSQKTVVLPKHIQEFEALMESKFYIHVKECFENRDSRIDNLPDYLREDLTFTLVTNSITEYADVLKDNMCNSEFNTLLSNQEISTIIERIENKVTDNVNEILLKNL